MDSIKEFGFDWMMSGTRDNLGNCGRGDPFTWDGKQYDYHAKIASLVGWVTEEIFTVDTATSQVIINGVAVNSTYGHYLSDGVRYIWEPKDYQREELQCSESVRQVYHGNATISEWAQYNESKPMLTGGDHKRGQFFGVHLTGKEVGVCGRNAKVKGLKLFSYNHFF